MAGDQSLCSEKHLRAGECQGAKKNEEKDTKKRKPRLDFRFLCYSLKKIRGTDHMINTL